MLTEKTKLNVKNRAPSPTDPATLKTVAALTVSFLVFGTVSTMARRRIPLNRNLSRVFGWFTGAGVALAVFAVFQEVLD